MDGASAVGAAVRLAAEPGVRAADERALADFCRREHPRLVGALTLYTGDRHLAEELAQDALVRVVANWKRVSGMESPAAWAHRVAVNLANSSFRRALARLEARPVAPAGEADAATLLALRQAVAALPERQRAAVVLRYYADLSSREVAQVMGCREGTVWALVHQAIASLRRMPGFETVEADDA